MENEDVWFEKRLNKAAAYVRFSSETQRFESIIAQLRAIKDYARRNGIVLVAEYQDAAKSATTDKRPAFQDMIRDAKSGLFNMVLVHKLDRFSRSRKDSIIYRAELKKYNVKLISVLENVDDESPESVIIESMLEGISEYYSRNLAREVEKGMMESARACRHVGGTPPLGYDVDPVSHKYIINEKEAGVVKLIFELYLKRVGYSKIIDELILRGLKTKTGQDFGKNSLYSIITNEKYTGVYIYNKSSKKDAEGKRNSHKYKNPKEILKIEGGMPVIISAEDFEAAQILLGKKIAQRKGHSSSNNYMLTGKLFCQMCGSTYVGNSRKDRGNCKGYLSYRCTKKNGKVKCTNSEIIKEDFEKKVLNELHAFISQRGIVSKLVKEYNNYLKLNDAQAYFHKLQIEKKIVELTRKISNIVNAIADTGSDACVDELNKLECEKARLEFEDNRLAYESNIKKVSDEHIKKSFELINELLSNDDVNSNQEIIDRFIERINISKENIDVFFNFGFALPNFNKPQTNNDVYFLSLLRTTIMRGGTKII